MEAAHNNLGGSAAEIPAVMGATGGTSGSTDRWFGHDPVRHASATTAVQGRTATHHDPQWDTRKTARKAGNTQRTGRFRWWGQVPGPDPVRPG